MNDSNGCSFHHYRTGDRPLAIYRLRPLHRDAPGPARQRQGERVARIVDDDHLVPRIPGRGRCYIIYHHVIARHRRRDVAVDRLPAGHSETGMRAAQRDRVLEKVVNVLVLNPEVPMDDVDGIGRIVAVGGRGAIGQAVLVPQEFVALGEEGYSLRGQYDGRGEFLDALQIAGIPGLGVALRPLQDTVSQAEIVVDADEIDALLGTGSKHAVGEIVERLIGEIAEANAAPAAGLDLIKGVALVEHVPAAPAPVEIAAAYRVAILEIECTD